MERISETFNCDCLDYMRGLPDNHFSLVIWDPPYGINANKMGMGGTADHKRVARKMYKEHTDAKKKGRLNSGGGKLKERLIKQSLFEWDNEIPSQECFDEVFRVSKNQIIWGANYFGNLPASRCWIAWDKVQPWENFSQIELAWTSFDMPAKLFRFDNRTGDKIHPTQKPVELYGWLLKNFCNPDDHIFDPMMGSQSSRIAAYKMGFDFTGCEIYKEYYDKGCERFNLECKGELKTPKGKTLIQTSLFD